MDKKITLSFCLHSLLGEFCLLEFSSMHFLKHLFILATDSFLGAELVDRFAHLIFLNKGFLLKEFKEKLIITSFIRHTNDY